MEKRIKIHEVDPQAFKAMSGLEGYVRSSGINPIHLELIKLRSSQINKCAFCLDMHSKDARKAGETEQRIYVLNGWQEAGLYTEEEKAILALTEEVTLIHQHGVSEQTYRQAEDLLGKTYLAKVIVAIITINAWNRVAITTQLEIPNQ